MISPKSQAQITRTWRLVIVSKQWRRLDGMLSSRRSFPHEKTDVSSYVQRRRLKASQEKPHQPDQ